MDIVRYKYVFKQAVEIGPGEEIGRQGGEDDESQMEKRRICNGSLNENIRKHLKLSMIAYSQHEYEREDLEKSMKERLIWLKGNIAVKKIDRNIYICNPHRR